MNPGDIIGKYKLLAPLGAGSMGQVWKVADSQGRIRALKTINQEYAADPQLRARFRFEAQRHLRLRHPNVVPTLEFFECRGKLYLVMEYIRGGSLASRLMAAPQHRLSVPEALSISRQVLSALNSIHQSLIVHRDVKPSNILLDGDHAYLADFGIALSIGGQRLTKFLRPVGTAEYMSPEQVKTPQQINHLSDVYSFGCVLYEMLAGRPPFVSDQADSGSGYEVQSKHVNETPEPIRKFNPDVPERLERMIAVALEKDPAKRFPGCGSFARALDAVVIPVKGGGEPEQPPRKLAVPLKSNLITLACSFAGILMLPFVLHNGQLLDAMILVQTVVAFVTLAVTLHRSWKSIQDEHTPIKPGRAVGLLFAPFYNLYWFYRVVPGFAKEFNLFAKRNHRDTQPLSRNWVLAASVLASLHLSTSLLGWFSTALKCPPALITWVNFVDCFVLVPALTGMMLTACNRLRQQTPVSNVLEAKAARAA